MLNRRKFFGSCAAALVVSGLVEEQKEEALIRKFHRYDRAGDKWVELPPDEIAVGDEIWIQDIPTSEVDGLIIRVTEVDRRRKEISSDYQIDPGTNRWVPAHFDNFKDTTSSQENEAGN